MHRSGAVLALVTVVVAGGCGLHRSPADSPATALAPTEVSGFLDEYGLLREGGKDEIRYVYLNPKAEWHRYHSVLLEPVTLWRSGRGSLDPVPEADLLRLAGDFENALRRRLGEAFRIVTQPGPGVMRIRLGITEARAKDPILDVLTATRQAAPKHAGGPLDEETRRFLAAASIEGEIRDAQNGALLAAGVDRRRDPNSLAEVSRTWDEVDQRLALWVERLCTRLEARTGSD